MSTNPALAKRRNRDGDLPLHVTLTNQEEASALIVVDLLQAYPDAASVRNNGNYMPLFLACKKSKIHPSIIKAILNCYPKATCVKQYGSTSLHALTYTGSGHADAIKYLLAVDVSLASQVNNFNNLPLHYLVVNQSSQISTESIRCLVNAYPDGVLFKNKLGETPLSRLIARYNNDIITGEDMEVVRQGLRYMLRSVDYNLLQVNEQNILKQLNWQARRDVVMGLALGNVDNNNNYYNSESNHLSCLSSMNSTNSSGSVMHLATEINKEEQGIVENNTQSHCVTIQQSHTDVDNDNSLYAKLLFRLHCNEVKNKIFSFL